MDIMSGNVNTATLHLRIPKSMEALQAEILKHRALLHEIRLEEANGRLKTFEDALAIVAAFVDVTLHGVYGADEIEDISNVLLNKLIQKRGVI